MHARAVPVAATGVTKTFDSGRVVAVHDAQVLVEPGEIVAVEGPSGSGKSTLLQLLAGLERPDAGSISIGGTQITDLRDAALTRLRRRSIGFVFQDFQLLPRMTAGGNITLPLRLDHREVPRREYADLVERLGLEDRLDHYPAQLSGGQCQRVAVARALLPRPQVIFADEPTGALDGQAAASLMDLFRWSAQTRGQSFVVVTHDERVTAQADSVYRMRDGQLSEKAAV